MFRLTDFVEELRDPSGGLEVIRIGLPCQPRLAERIVPLAPIEQPQAPRVVLERGKRFRLHQFYLAAFLLGHRHVEFVDNRPDQGLLQVEHCIQGALSPFDPQRLLRGHVNRQCFDAQLIVATDERAEEDPSHLRDLAHLRCGFLVHDSCRCEFQLAGDFPDAAAIHHH